MSSSRLVRDLCGPLGFASMRDKLPAHLTFGALLRLGFDRLYGILAAAGLPHETAQAFADVLASKYFSEMSLTDVAVIDEGGRKVMDLTNLLVPSFMQFGMKALKYNVAELPALLARDPDSKDAVSALILSSNNLMDADWRFIEEAVDFFEDVRLSRFSLSF